MRTVWSLHRFKYRAVESEHAELPTLSVCIAARNETHALAQCLEQILRSDYPKLEILVLDDSSDDDTSLIIKSFAHAGVRFIPGKVLPDGWLGKNHAYQTLLEESSGEYVLFLDVDTSVRVTTISQLVAQLIANNKTMLSVLPRRENSYYSSAVFGTMRYYWELLLGTKNSPPASSALWLVKRSALKPSNGLRSYSLSIRPERHIARQLQSNMSYYYVIGTKQLGVAFEKRLKSQYETALRLYYPMSGRNLLRWVLALSYLVVLLIPVCLVFISSEFLLKLWAAGLIFVLTIAYAVYTHRTYANVTWQIKSLLWPLMLLQEMALLSTSYMRYRFGTVTWKGRAVNAQPIKHDAINLGE